MDTAHAPVRSNHFGTSTAARGHVLGAITAIVLAMPAVEAIAEPTPATPYSASNPGGASSSGDSPTHSPIGHMDAGRDNPQDAAQAVSRYRQLR